MGTNGLKQHITSTMNENIKVNVGWVGGDKYYLQNHQGQNL